jgi:hypothetical protein
MTLGELKAGIYGYLIDNDFFTCEDFLREFPIILENPEEVKDLVLLGVKFFEEKGFLVKLPNYDKWVLSQKIQTLEQTVQVSGSTASYISAIITAYSKEKELNYKVDPTNIQEKDILVLIQMIVNASSSASKDE